MPRYLEKRYRCWYAVLDVPKDVQAKIGKKRFFVSLKTESQTEAERLVHLRVGRWKAEIAAARTGSTDILAKAEAWAQDYAVASGAERQVLEEVLEDEIDNVGKRHPEKGKTFGMIVRGESIFTTHHLAGWLATQKNESKTIAEKRSAVERFSVAFPFTHKANRQKVREWANRLLHDERLARATVTKMLSALSGYWTYLQGIGAVKGEEKLFVGLLPTAKRKSKTDIQAERKPFTAEQVCQLLEAAQKEKNGELVAKFIWLAMWTGCRIEEIASLKIDAVTEDRIKIEEAKTKAGLREIPIHSKLKPAIALLKGSSYDGYLVSGLTFTIHMDRSQAISKRFGRLKRKLGFGPDYVFHSIRKTVATLLEQADVNETVAADIAGHEKKTMTYGHYSGGSSFKAKSEAIEKLSYPISSLHLLANSKTVRVGRRHKPRKDAE